MQFGTPGEARNWQSQIEKQKKLLLEPPAFELAAKGAKPESVRRIRNKVLAVMDKVVTRQIAKTRRLEMLGASDEVIALFEEECQQWLEDVGEILDEIDFKVKRAAGDEDERQHEFMSCASKTSTEEAREQAGFVTAAPEEGNKPNIPTIPTIKTPEPEIVDFYNTTRMMLPHLKDPNQKISVFKLLKDCVGKDLTRISLPVTLNEPLSMLQRLTENYQY